MIGGAVLIFFVVLAIAGIGFVAGYRGTWKHSAAAIGALLAVWMIPQSVMAFFYHLPTKALSGDLLVSWLVTFGSLVGALIARRTTVGIVIATHAGFIAGGFILVSILAVLTGNRVF